MTEALKSEPMRPDGTYNLDREACAELARTVLSNTKGDQT